MPCVLAEPLERRTLFAVGSVDPGFGTNGGVTVSFPGGNGLTAVRDSVVLADGRVVVAGRAADAGGTAGATDMALARLNADGTVDTTFGTNGVTVIHSDTNTDSVERLALQADGKIVLTGYFAAVAGDGSTTTEQFVVARLTANGQPDATFGGGTGNSTGVQTPLFGNTAVPQQAEGRSVLVLADGSILAAGAFSDGPTPTDAVHAALAKYRPDGTLDPAFGTGGLVGLSVTGGSESLIDIAVQKNGDIVAVGTLGPPAAPVPSFLIERFEPNGAVDTGFGAKGATAVTFAGATSAVARTLTIQSNGNIVFAGYVITGDLNNRDNEIYNFGLARVNSKGKLDKKFGKGGQVLGSPSRLQAGFNGYEVVDRIMLESDGGIIVSGLHADNTTVADQGQVSATVAGYESNGDPDTGFGTNGQMVFGTTAGLTPGLVPAIVTQGQQFQDAQRQQAAIARAVGNRIVLVNSSGGSVQLRRLIGDGPDLSVGPPANVSARSVLSGSAGTVTVPLTNVGNLPFAGPVNLSLFLTDGTNPANDRAITIMGGTNAKAKNGTTRALKVKFTFPADAPDGMYFLKANIAPVAGADTDTSNNTATGAEAITVARAFVDLAGVFVSATGASGGLSVGKMGKLSIRLTNNGNVPAKGTVSVTVTATASGGAPQAITVPKPLKVSLKPSQSRNTSLGIVVPAGLTPGAYTLSAVLDATALNDTNLTNNTLTAGTPVQIG